jgi:hypothetical protein
MFKNMAGERGRGKEIEAAAAAAFQYTYIEFQRTRKIVAS